MTRWRAVIPTGVLVMLAGASAAVHMLSNPVPKDCRGLSDAISAQVSRYWWDDEAQAALRSVSESVGVRIDTTGAMRFVNIAAVGPWMYECARNESKSAACAAMPNDSVLPLPLHRRASRVIATHAERMTVPTRYVSAYRATCGTAPVQASITTMVIDRPQWWVQYTALSVDGGASWRYVPAYGWVAEPGTPTPVRTP